jgi:hypothetical protein
MCLVLVQRIVAPLNEREIGSNLFLIDFGG